MLQNNWTFLLNQVPASRTTVSEENRNYALALINFLIANGWTADGSSNSVSTHATNNIATIADIVCAPSGTAHTWIILKSKEGFCAGHDGSYLGDQSRIWILFNFEHATPIVAEYLITTYHQVKPTGGTITNAPTSTNSLVYSNSASNQYGRTALTRGPARYHFAITEKGHFWSAITYYGTRKMTFITCIFPLSGGFKYCDKDHPYGFVVCQYYQDLTTKPDFAILTTYSNCWSFSNVPGLAYPVFPTYGLDNPIGGSMTNGVNANGEILSFPIGFMDSYTVAVSPKFMGFVDDFEFMGATQLPSRTMNATFDKCSFYQWFFPVNQRIQA